MMSYIELRDNSHTDITVLESILKLNEDIFSNINIGKQTNYQRGRTME